MWKLTEAAIDDLDRISAEGALRYGYGQSEAYERKLVNLLDALAAHPYMAPERRATVSSVRLMPSGAHNILYTIENEDVIVLRVLHHLQDWFDLL